MDTLNRSVARTPPATKLEIVGYVMVAVGYVVMTLGIVEIGERPAAPNLCAHGAEVARAHDPKRGAERFVRLRRAFDSESVDPVGIERVIVGEAARPHLGNGGEPLEKSAMKPRDRGPFSILRRGEVDLGEKDVLGPEAEVEVSQADEALEEQGSADHQHHRERE